MKKRSKIGLVLGGGGARGLAHLGVLKVLMRENIKFDLVVGTSIGALAGALFVLDVDLLELEEEILKTKKTEILKDFVDLGNPKSSVIKGRKIFNYIKTKTKNSNFKDAKIPLKIITTNLGNGREVIFDKGSVTKAVMASITVPGIFPPVEIGGSYYIDGGVVNPTPVDIAKKSGMDKIIAVDLMTTKNIKFDRKPGMINTLMQSYEIIRTQAIEEKFREQIDDLVIIKPRLRSLTDSFKFHDAQKFIRAGERAAEEKIGEIKSLLQE